MGEISIRKAAAEDFDFFYTVKSEEDNIYWAGHSLPPTHENLFSFFFSNIQNQAVRLKRTIFIVEEKKGNQSVGYLYLDPLGIDYAEISIGIMQAFSGQGYGRQAVSELCELAYGFGFRNILAMVREDNLRSQKMFQHAGFDKTGSSRLQFIQNLNKEIKMLEFEKVR